MIRGEFVSVTGGGGGSERLTLEIGVMRFLQDGGGAEIDEFRVTVRQIDHDVFVLKAGHAKSDAQANAFECVDLTYEEEAP